MRGVSEPVGIGLKCFVQSSWLVAPIKKKKKKLVGGWRVRLGTFHFACCRVGKAFGILGFNRLGSSYSVLILGPA